MAQRPSPTRTFLFRCPAISHTILAKRSGVECRAGGTGAESGVSHRMVASVFTGDFGKHVRHPHRKRKVMRNHEQAQWPAPTRGLYPLHLVSRINFKSTEGRGGLPLHGILCSGIQPFSTPSWQSAAGWNVEWVVRVTTPSFSYNLVKDYCYRLWPKACLFKVVWAFVAQIGMPSVAIVPSLDTLKDVLCC